MTHLKGNISILVPCEHLMRNVHLTLLHLCKFMVYCLWLTVRVFQLSTLNFQQIRQPASSKTDHLVLACRNPQYFVVAGLRTGLKRRRLRRASTTNATDLRKQAIALAALLLFLVCAPGRAEQQNLTAPQGGKLTAHVWESDLPDSWRFRATGQVHLEYGGRTLDADSAEGNLETGEMSASGNLILGSEFGAMRAERLRYNLRTGVGFLESATARGDGIIFRGARIEAEPKEFIVREATATGCDRTPPHYRLTARQIVVRPGDRAIARHASVWIGNTRLITIPSLRFGLGPKNPEEFPLPMPGYDKDDGVFVKFTGDLISARRTYLSGELRPTMRRGIQGRVDYEYLLGGRPSTGSGSGPAMRQSFMNVENDLRKIGFGLPGSQEERRMPGERGYEVRGFISARVKEKAYDYDNPRLRVTYWPEVGVKCISGPSDWFAAPVQATSGEARLSYGRFREYPGSVAHERWDLRALGATRIARIGKPTTVRLIGMVRESAYSTHETYRVLGGGIDISHTLSPRTGMTARFITNYVSGKTPFAFDDVDIRSEADLILRRVTKSGSRQLTLRYDLGENRLYDWEVSISKVYHCLEPSITWRKKFGQLTLGMNLVFPLADKTKR